MNTIDGILNVLIMQVYRLIMQVYHCLDHCVIQLVHLFFFLNYYSVGDVDPAVADD